MRLIQRFILALMLFCTTQKTYSQLQIVPQTNAQALAQKLVGGGVTISNVTLTGSSLSTAFFYNQGGTQLAMDSGIVLSTGRVLSAPGLPGLNGSASQLANSQTNTPGDPDLSALVAPRPTNDAVVLEFDFIPIGDSVKFRYVFSSDEYPTFTCSNFNDVFAFFISGPGISGSQNMALVPNTNIPVAINSINSGTPGGSYMLSTCSSMGPGSPFTQYYVNNAGNPYFTLNGHTTVLTALASVQPCQVYHLKIAIADVQDRSYDSGVFLEAESLRSDPIHIVSSLPVINGLPYLVEGCQPGGIKIVRSRKSPVSMPVNLAFSGSAVNGIDYQTVPAVATIPAFDSVVFVPIIPIVDNLPEGTETIKIYISNGCILTNFYLDSVEIELKEYDTLGLNPRNVAICKNSSVQLTATGTYATYQWTPATGLSNAAIYNPLATPTGNMTYTATAVLGDCHARDSVVVAIKTLDFVSKKNINCANGHTGEIRVSGGAEWKAPVQYSLNNGAYISDSTFSGLAAGNYTVKIQDASGCVDSMQVSLVQAFPDLTLADSALSASCSGINGQVLGFAGGGKAPYSFSIDGGAFVTSNNFNVNSGNHQFTVKDSNGCLVTRPVVIATDVPINLITTANPASCSGSADGTIYVHATGGSGQYQYSIDGVNFQAADSFMVTVGNLTVQVKDNKGCTASQNVSIPLNQTIFVNAGNDTTICEGSSFQLHTLANASTFTWAAASSLSSTTIANPMVSPTVTTTYYVTATRDICTVYDTITVAVWAAPIANAGPDSSICRGRTIQLNASGGTSYSWLPASEVSNPNIANPTVHPSQTAFYFVKVFDNHNCPSLKYDTVRIGIVPSVQAFAGRDTSITVGQPLQLQGADLGNSGATIFEWSPAYGLNNPNVLNPVATLDRDMTYTLKMTTPEGCEGSDQVFVKVFKGPEIFVPSGFTPNGDGRNDLLLAFPIGMREFHFFRVYNRWGQLIFSSVNEKMGWDGSVNGLQQGTGTYVWVAEAVDYTGKLVVRKGVSTLIR